MSLNFNCLKNEHARVYLQTNLHVINYLLVTYMYTSIKCISFKTTV